jgi:uncharacterized RDD family membrane protein YckC
MKTRSARDLIVDSVTGVELALPIAGPGARCYAFLIDWTIRAILSTAWYCVAALLYNGHWSFVAPLNPDTRWFLLVVTPAAAIYFLYHLALELVMHGRTPGKRMAGIRIVMRDGSMATAAALLIRNVFRLVDSLPLLYGVGLVTTLVTNDHLRIGDMAAGTLLMYERGDVVLLEAAGTTARGRALDTSNVEIINDLLLRWQALDRRARRRLAIEILSRHAVVATVSDEDSQQIDLALRSQLEELAAGHAMSSHRS